MKFDDVYVMHSEREGVCKIGISTCAHERAKQVRRATRYTDMRLVYELQVPQCDSLAIEAIALLLLRRRLVGGEYARCQKKTAMTAVGIASMFMRDPTSSPRIAAMIIRELEAHYGRKLDVD